MSLTCPPGGRQCPQHPELRWLLRLEDTHPFPSKFSAQLRFNPDHTLLRPPGYRPGTWQTAHLKPPLTSRPHLPFCFSPRSTTSTPVPEDPQLPGHCPSAAVLHHTQVSPSGPAGALSPPAAPAPPFCCNIVHPLDCPLGTDAQAWHPQPSVHISCGCPAQRLHQSCFVFLKTHLKSASPVDCQPTVASGLKAIRHLGVV